MLFIDKETYYKYTFFPSFAIVVVPFVALVEHTAVEPLAAVLLVVPLVVVLQAVGQHMLSILEEYVPRHISVENYMVDNFASGFYMDSIQLFQRRISIEIV